MKSTLLIFLVGFGWAQVEARNLSLDSSMTQSIKNIHPQELSHDALLAELTGKDLSKESEKFLFSQIVYGYRTNNGTIIDRHLRALINQYPKSPLIDNSIYLAGLYKLNMKKFGDAIKFFNQIKTEYPNGNKKISAEFAKAMSYKMMGLNDFSEGILKEIQTQYPGSPEAMRASNELKLMGVKK